MRIKQLKIQNLSIKSLVILLILIMTSTLAFLLSIFKRRPQPRISKYNNLPSPKVSHLELNANMIRNRNVFVIGDVHGCYDELCELMEKARLKDHNILFILVGDLINKGPKSKEVLQLVQSMECYVVRGNHDEYLLHQYLKNLNPLYNLPEHVQWIESLPSTDFEYLKDLPYTISIPSLSALVVHAGLVPGLPLTGQDFTAMTHMRNIEEKFSMFHGIYPNLMPIESTARGVPWASLWSGPEHVYFGHDAVRDLQLYPHATGLDTGCVYGKRLTGVFLHSREFLFVDSKQPDMFGGANKKS